MWKKKLISPHLDVECFIQWSKMIKNHKMHQQAFSETQYIGNIYLRISM